MDGWTEQTLVSVNGGGWGRLWDADWLGVASIKKIWKTERDTHVSTYQTRRTLLERFALFKMLDFKLLIELFFWVWLCIYLDVQTSFAKSSRIVETSSVSCSTMLNVPSHSMEAKGYWYIVETGHLFKLLCHRESFTHNPHHKERKKKPVSHIILPATWHLLV